jgi:hypothetical protein
MYVGISILRRTERESAERRPLLPSFTVNARHRRLSDLELFRSIHLRFTNLAFVSGGSGGRLDWLGMGTDLQPYLIGVEGTPARHYRLGHLRPRVACAVDGVDMLRAASGLKENLCVSMVVWKGGAWAENLDVSGSACSFPFYHKICCDAFFQSSAAGGYTAAAMFQGRCSLRGERAAGMGCAHTAPRRG